MPHANAALIATLQGALLGRSEVRLVLLFGSQARGTGGPHSDVDIAVEGAVDTLELAAHLSLACGQEVDVVSLRDVGYPLLTQLVKDSVVIHQVPGAGASWRTRALLTMETDGPWFGRMRDAWLRHVAGGGE